MNPWLWSLAALWVANGVAAIVVVATLPEDPDEIRWTPPLLTLLLMPFLLSAISAFGPFALWKAVLSSRELQRKLAARRPLR